MDKSLRPKFIVLKDRKTGSIEDICRIERKSTGTMDGRKYFLHNLNVALNPFYSTETSYESITQDATYDPRAARRFYRAVRL